MQFLVILSSFWPFWDFFCHIWALYGNYTALDINFHSQFFLKQDVEQKNATQKQLYTSKESKNSFCPFWPFWHR